MSFIPDIEELYTFLVQIIPNNDHHLLSLNIKCIIILSPNKSNVFDFIKMVVTIDNKPCQLQLCDTAGQVDDVSFACGTLDDDNPIIKAINRDIGCLELCTCCTQVERQPNEITNNKKKCHYTEMLTAYDFLSSITFQL
ncbi:hypothetical protein BLOT_005008 [Blomia tropicalis]|nr:hypothetical protein BLOT_005008 [Blomia tropicalis]